MLNQLLTTVRSQSRLRMSIIKGIIILAFILLAELKTCAALTLQTQRQQGIARAESSRKKSMRIRQRFRKQQHAVINACAYKRRSTLHGVGYARYR